MHADSHFRLSEILDMDLPTVTLALDDDLSKPSASAIVPNKKPWRLMTSREKLAQLRSQW